MQDHGSRPIADDRPSGSRYRLSLLRGVLSYRLLGGIAPILSLLTIHGHARPVLLLVLVWLLIMTGTVIIWRAVQRRHLVQPRVVLPWLVADTVVAVAANLMAVLTTPGTIQDSFETPFWFLAQANVAAWALFTGGRVAMTAITGWSAVIVVMIILDPRRPAPVDFLVEAGFVGAHVAWLGLAAVTLIIAGRLIRLGSSAALADGVHLGRHAAQARMLRELHDTVLQTLEAVALRAGDPRGDPHEELAAIGRAARWQADDIRRSLRRPWPDDDLYSTFMDLRQRFAARLDVELEFLDSARAARVPAEVSDALRGAVHECLTNIVKHAGVSRAFIEVDRTSAAVRVRVRDHGRGFVPHDVVPGFGLAQSITQRLEEVGGHVDLASTPGGGTVVSLVAPLSFSPAGVHA